MINDKEIKVGGCLFLHRSKPSCTNIWTAGDNQYEEDRKKGMHEVELPGALAMKYPNAPYEMCLSVN